MTETEYATRIKEIKYMPLRYESVRSILLLNLARAYSKFKETEYLRGDK